MLRLLVAAARGVQLKIFVCSLERESSAGHGAGRRSFVVSAFTRGRATKVPASLFPAHHALSGELRERTAHGFDQTDARQGGELGLGGQLVARAKLVAHRRTRSTNAMVFSYRISPGGLYPASGRRDRLCHCNELANAFTFCERGQRGEWSPSAGMTAPLTSECGWHSRQNMGEPKCAELLPAALPASFATYRFRPAAGPGADLDGPPVGAHATNSTLEPIVVTGSYIRPPTRVALARDHDRCRFIERAAQTASRT